MEKCKGSTTANNIVLVTLTQRILWKTVFLFMGLFFFAAVYVQHNDPDPYWWMLVYVVPLSANAIFITYLPCVSNSKFWSLFNTIVVCHCCYCFLLGFWTILHYYLYTYSLTHNDFQFRNQEIISGLLSPSLTSEPNMQLEEAKELLGLCLVISWLAFLFNANFLKSGNKGVATGIILTLLPIIAWVFVDVIENDQVACV